MTHIINCVARNQRRMVDNLGVHDVTKNDGINRNTCISLNVNNLYRAVDFEAFLRLLRCVPFCTRYAAFVASDASSQLTFAQWVNGLAKATDCELVVAHIFRSPRMKVWRQRRRWANCSEYHAQVLTMRRDLGVHLLFVDARVGFGLFVDRAHSREALVATVRRLTALWGNCLWTTDHATLVGAIQDGRVTLRSVFGARDGSSLSLLFGPLSLLNHAANSSILLTTAANGDGMALTIGDGPLVFATKLPPSAPPNLVEIRIQYGQQFDFSAQTSIVSPLSDEYALHDDKEEFEPRGKRRRKKL
jgi:hypothetical protein